MTTTASKSKAQKLTKRQAAILKFVTDTIDNYGKSPTLRAIGAHFGIESVNGVACHVQAIERKGYLSRVNGKLLINGPSYTDGGMFK